VIARAGGTIVALAGSLDPGVTPHVPLRAVEAASAPKRRARRTKQMENEVVQKASHALSERAHQVGNKIDELADNANQLYGRGKERALEWRDSVDHYVQDRPMKSVLIAAGLGLFVGALLARR
jgi:ElaB/YqjD/DUF883 family membrane-anchored ribosome-binding protein